MKVTLQFVFFIVLLTSGATTAFACDCDSQSQRQRFRTANSVFVGEVLEFKERAGFETEKNEDLKNFYYQVNFKVEKQWKGKRQTEISALAGFDMKDFCGDLDLQVGKRFLIYAPRDYGRLIIYRDCGPNREVEHAKDEIKNLNNFFFRTYTFFYPYPKF